MIPQTLNIPFKNLGQLIDYAADQYRDRQLWQSIDDDSVMTFTDLAAKTITLACALRDLGVKQGDHIAVMLPAISEFAVVWGAIARLGAVIVPVNYHYTSHELDYVLNDSESLFLIIHDDKKSLFDGLGSGSRYVPESNVIVCGETDRCLNHSLHMLLQSQPAGNMAMLDISPRELMSIQYTSGTTGFPKGCMLSHDYWLVLGAVRSLQLPQPKRILLDKPLSYMGGIWRLLICLYQGATACIAHKFTLSGMQKRIVDNRIDLFSVTDPVANLPDDSNIREMKFSCITASGLNKNLHLLLERKFNAPVRELYGMTEIGSAIYMPLEDGTMSGSGSCGKPAPFRECRIVDRQGNDVEPGESGELWIRGRAIFDGYYNKQEATQKAFSAGWFRTGDIFRQDENGYFYIVGRIKDSIRRSGENISSQEVASVVTSIAGVMEAVAVGVPDEFRGEEVKVLIVLQPGVSTEEISPEVVIGHCEEQLAPFKVPRYIQYVPEFPYTSSGKIAISAIKTSEAFRQVPFFDRMKNNWISS